MLSDSGDFPFPTFEYVDPKHPYEHLKYIAIHQLGLQIFHGLNLIHGITKKIYYCENVDNDDEEEEQQKPDEPRFSLVSHLTLNLPITLHGVLPDSDIQDKVFTWSLQECLKRLKHDKVWINIMETQWTPVCLEFKKVEADAKELNRLIKLILLTYINESFEFHTVFRQLREIDKYNRILDRLSGKLERSKAILREQRQTGVSMMFIAHTSNSKSYSLREGRLNVAEINAQEDVNFRYQYNFVANQTQQAEIVAQQKVKNSKEQHTEAERIFKTELICFNALAATYESQIDSLRERIAVMTTKYDIDFQNASDAVAILRSKYNYLVSQRQYLEDERIRFREELKAYRLAILNREKTAAAEEEERLRLLNEENERKLAAKKAKTKEKKAKLQQKKIDKMAADLRKASRKYRHEAT